MFKKHKTITKFLYLIPTIILLAVLAATLNGMIPRTANSQPIVMNKEYLNQGFDIMLEVYPSEISPQLIQVVRDRVDCYSQLPENRLSGRCHGKYLNSLLLIGRSKIHDSAPDLGIFLDLVDSCPTMYSVCRGKDLTESYCGEIEAKCLDYFFDQYWRGAPYFTDVQAF